MPREIGPTHHLIQATRAGNGLHSHPWQPCPILSTNPVVQASSLGSFFANYIFYPPGWLRVLPVGYCLEPTPPSPSLFRV